VRSWWLISDWRSRSRVMTVALLMLRHIWQFRKCNRRNTDNFERAALLLRIQKITSSNLDPNIGHTDSGFSWILCLKLDHNHSLEHLSKINYSLIIVGASGSVVGWGTMLQAGRSRVRFPVRSLDYFFNWPNHSSRSVDLGLTQPLTEMSTRDLGGKGRPAGA
jgi:hypothetical protein